MGKREQRRRQRKRLFDQQHGRCFWCGEPMVIIEQHVKRPPLNLATIDHLDDRLSPMRGKHPPGVRRHVLACKECNEKRGVASVQALPADEVHRRSGRFPAGAAA